MTDYEGAHEGAEVDDAVGVAKGAGTGLVVKTSTGQGVRRQLKSSDGSVEFTDPSGVGGDPDLKVRGEKVPEADRVPMAPAASQYLDPGWQTPHAVLLPEYEDVPAGYYDTGERVGTNKVVVNWELAQLYDYGEIDGSAADPDGETVINPYPNARYAAPGSSAREILDRSRSNSLVLSDELVTNGDFSDGLNGWTVGTDESITVTQESDHILISADRDAAESQNNTFYQNGVFNNEDSLYLVDIEVENVERYASVFCGRYREFGRAENEVGRSRIKFIVRPNDVPGNSLAGANLIFGNNSYNLCEFKLFFVSVKEIISVELPWYQPNSTQQGLYGEIPLEVRNLLSYTDDLSESDWIKAGASVTDLGNDEWEVRDDTTEFSHSVRNLSSSEASTIARTLGVELKAGTINWVRVSLLYNSRPNDNCSVIDLSTATVFDSRNIDSVGVTSLDDGWVRIEITATTETSRALAVQMLDGSAPAGNATSTEYAGDGNGTIFLRYPELQEGSTLGPFQRVGAAGLDVTESGVRSLPVIRMDQVDDEYPTPAIASGITNGTVVVAGRDGTWIEEGVNIADGESFVFGPDGYTNGVRVGVLTKVTGSDIVDWLIIDGTLSDVEMKRLRARLKAKGAGPLYAKDPSSELVTNGDFATGDITGWTDASGTAAEWSVVGEQLVCNNVTDNGNRFYQNTDSSMEAGALYLASFEMVDVVDDTRGFSVKVRDGSKSHVSGSGDDLVLVWADYLHNINRTYSAIFEGIAQPAQFWIQQATSADGRTYDNFSILKLVPEDL